ncbi:hypothetical protein [Methanolobus bombayensis]|uniref:hypothetical protein n=1 Tax=Methanolobus bombayensis TaxID=38023 RepID=UPI001AEB1967|nr:hypothetical protein [Methanolobus bombayensis]MBP1909197.1 hypothetical protein [Methanolobus bombayensis]
MKNEKDFTIDHKTLEHTMGCLCELVLNDEAYLKSVFESSSTPSDEVPVVAYVTQRLFKMCEGFDDRKGRMFYVDKLFKGTLKRLRDEYLSELEDIDLSDVANLPATIYNLNEFQAWHLGKMLDQYSEFKGEMAA